MNAPLSRAVMAVASACLGGGHREWARAMEVELEVAIAEGNGLGFAAGCLAAAMRELPARAEGRLLLARYALVLGMILPIAAVISTSALLGFPPLQIGAGGGADAGRALGQIPVLNDGNRTAAPILAWLVLAAAASQPAMAWFLLDCDWRRVARTASLAASVTVTLVIFAGVAALGTAPILLPMAGLTAELAAIALLVGLHARHPACAGWADAKPGG